MLKLNLVKRVVRKLVISPLSNIERRYSWKRKSIYVAPGSFVHPSVNIGKGTRINNASHIGPCTIGKYCAIGGRLVVRSSDHYVGYLNMQDFLQREVIDSDVQVSGKSKGNVNIGNSVWIGDSVIILSGVEVGDGAVIGAGSTVTKSIPPYAIAVGNPARVIKYRFSQDIIDKIGSLKWWDWSEVEMKSRRAFFELDLQSIDAEKLDAHIKSFSK